ncbi:hypothetical protein ACVBEJ_10280 [Porticoccus sp. GXU_MW_L64]
MKTLFFFVLITTGIYAQAEQTNIAEDAVNLVIQRPHQKAMLSYLDYRLTLNGKSIGKLSNGETMEFRLQPGRYELMANDSKFSRISLLVEEGKTLVVDGRVGRDLQMSLVERSAQRSVASRGE